MSPLSSWFEFDRKGLRELRIKRRFFLGHTGYRGRARTVSEVSAKGFELSRGSYRVNLNAAVAQVSHVSAQAKPQRRPPGEVTVPDTLYHPADVKALRSVFYVHGRPGPQLASARFYQSQAAPERDGNGDRK
jgi:hypothetical protein